MNKAFDMDNEIKVKKHVEITETLNKLLIQDARKKTGGNTSWLLRNILRKHYNLEEIY